MRIRDILLALTIAFVWGANFSVIEIGLQSFPPLLFAALRFAVVAVVALVFFRVPSGQWSTVLQYGLYMGLLQFGSLFFAMNGHADAGTSALVLQAQVPLTMMLALVAMGETTSRVQWIGVALAGGALAALYLTQRGRMDGLGLLLTLFAAANFAAGNLTMRRAKGITGIQLVAWSCVLPPVPLFILSWFVERSAVVTAFSQADLSGWLALGYVSIFATLGGFGFWGVLLARYRTSQVLPFSFCVPIFAQVAAAIVLDEPLGVIQWTVTLGVVAGAMLCQYQSRPAAAPLLPSDRVERRVYDREASPAQCRACV